MAARHLQRLRREEQSHVDAAEVSSSDTESEAPVVNPFDALEEEEEEEEETAPETSKVFLSASSPRVALLPPPAV